MELGLLTLKKNKEFIKIYKKGLIFYGGFLKVYILQGKEGTSHYGISIRKNIGKAVKRNRIRRLIKEVLRKNEGFGIKGYDYIIIVRRVTDDLNYVQVVESIDKVFKKIRKKVKEMGNWSG